MNRDYLGKTVLLVVAFVLCGLSSLAATAPVITVQPADVLTNQNSFVVMSVQLQGTATGVGYQWWKDGHAMPGRMAATLTFDSVQPEDEGEYFVIINSSAGSIISRTATLRLAALAKAPARTDVALNAPATLSFETSGEGPFTFQWLKNGVEVPGATSTTLVFPHAQLSDTADYQVRVTTDLGTFFSDPVRLTVYILPSITKQPRPISIDIGDLGTLSVEAGGTPPFFYQWYKDGAPLANGTNATFSVTNARYTNSGIYSVVVSNPVASITSSNAPLAVGGPRVLQNPGATAVQPGASPGFNVQVEGEGPFAWQWLKDGVVLPGKTNANLTLSSVSFADDADYSVIISNSRGSTVSATAHLTILSAPKITAPPAPTSINLGGAGTLSVQAVGTAPLSWQWYKDGVLLSGATNPQLAFTSTTKANAGAYSVKISNSFGSITSDPVPLTVVALPTISIPPSNVAIREGASFNLSVDARSDGAMTYRWFKDGVLLPGASLPALSFGASKSTDSGTYTVEVSNSSGSVTSRPATVTVIIPPTFQTQPMSQTVYEGAALVLSAAVTGSSPITYQWFNGSTAIPGATHATFAIGAVTPNDAASYRVEASNPAGSVSSAVADITVFAKPIITLGPVDKTVNVGASVFFVAQASGSGTLRFQWCKNGTPIPGATIPALIISSVTQSDFASYTIRVTNDAGTTESAPAFLSQPGDPDQLSGRMTITGSIAGGFRISARGVPGTAYDLQGSSDLQNWSSVRSVTIDGSGIFTADPATQTAGRYKYFRTVRH